MGFAPRRPQSDGVLNYLSAGRWFRDRNLAIPVRFGTRFELYAHVAKQVTEPGRLPGVRRLSRRGDSRMGAAVAESSDKIPWFRQL